MNQVRANPHPAIVLSLTLSALALFLVQPLVTSAALPDDARPVFTRTPYPDDCQGTNSPLFSSALPNSFTLAGKADNLIALPDIQETKPPSGARAPGEKELFFEGSNFKGLTHIIGSHVAIVTQPVTAAIRLFFMVYDTGKDAVRWTWLWEFDGKPVPPLTDSPEMDLIAWEARLDKITRSPTSYGTVRFHLGGQEFFPQLMKEIDGAQKSIRVRTYIFDNDDFALEVADILKDRSRDLDVRVLLDGLGSIMANKVTSDTAPSGHSPPASVRGYLTRDSRVRVRQHFNTWLAGDHTKTIIIDSKLGFLGGMNIGREYRYEWHDLMAEVTGPVILELDRDFGRAWAGAGALGDIEKLIHGLTPRKKVKNDGSPPVRLLFTRPGNSQIRNAQLEAIRRSQKTIFIETPYLTDDGVVYELVKARRRGVDVKVIIPSATDRKIMDRSNALAANALIKNGVRVFLYPGMTHVKAAIYDGWACFGSANLDKLSFRVNYEIDLATSHPATVRELKNRLFLQDLKVSTELTMPIPVKGHDYLLEVLADQL